MKLADIVEQISVDPRKLTDYALNFESPWGRHKALVFKQALGFTQQNYADLLTQIKQQAMETEATFHSKDEFGERYTVDLIVQGTEERQGVVRTGWFVPRGSHQARLVTLYVRR
ncbi:MAG: hypothetical protein U9R15_15465 [Chloroflexota bacterium]|nr:hypothetical protein [Chloroflexota bacterium]